MRLATYNLKNLFLHDEGPEKPAHETRPLARMIDLVAADLLVVQEAGSQQSLETLNARLAAPYPHVHVVPGNSNRSIHLGVLSREAVTLTSHRELVLHDGDGQPLQWYPDEEAAAAGRAMPLKMQRDILQVEGRWRDCQFAAFVVHLKSRTNRAWQRLAAEDMRAAEVRALVEVLRHYGERHPRMPRLVAGDFNDRWLSESLTPLKALPVTDPLGTTLKAQGRNPSTYWPKRRMRIDHILLADPERLVVTDPCIHIGHMARTASDHYPVSVSLESPAQHQATPEGKTWS